MDANLGETGPGQSLDHLDRYRILFDSMNRRTPDLSRRVSFERLLIAELHYLR
jgi:hypothetical protein